MLFLFYFALTLLVFVQRHNGSRQLHRVCVSAIAFESESQSCNVWACRILMVALARCERSWTARNFERFSGILSHKLTRL